MIALIIMFVIGYVAIACEHKLHIDKSIPALLTGMLMWAYISVNQIPLVGGINPEYAIGHHIAEIASVLFFLIGAMTIVNALDQRGSLSIVKDWLITDNQVKLMWLTTTITFFLSAALDNLTTTIVMIAILSKLIEKRGDLLVFGVLVIIAANAGGAWSPIGDVTTTMLWVAGKVTTLKLIKMTFLASVSQVIFIPFVLTIFPKLLDKLTEGVVELKDEEKKKEKKEYQGKVFMLIIGVLGLLFVPIFKQLTHLPPWMGMMISTCIVLVVNEILNKKDSEENYILHGHLLEKVEWNAILFFLGILMAVAAFQSVAIESVSSLQYSAGILQGAMSDEWLGILIGMLSSIVDNVPIVAAAEGMFQFPTDHWFWHFLCYTAGTGGSILIIGSAAGVVAMGLLKIDALWYAKKFSFLILLSYLFGCGMFFLQQSLWSITSLWHLDGVPVIAWIYSLSRRTLSVKQKRLFL